MAIVSRAARAAMMSSAMVAGSLMIPCSADAQRYESRYGILAGASVNTISDLDRGLAGDLGAQLNTKNRIGGQAALYARIPLKGALSLQPELHYIQKGGKVEVTDASIGNDAVDFSLKIGYVEIPVLARIDLGSGSWRPFITAGPTVALRTSCKLSFGSGSTNIATDCDSGDLGEGEEAASEDPIKKTDFGASAGVGIAGSLMGRSVFAQLRYNQGLATIAKDAPSSVSPKNRGFAVVVGLGF
ncbi:MAG: PorT family protein [Gemmatimonadaceae bacterium]|nr:PorT family protein [Gemmatimonadaceae bacterium]